MDALIINERSIRLRKEFAMGTSFHVHHLLLLSGIASYKLIVIHQIEIANIFSMAK